MKKMSPGTRIFAGQLCGPLITILIAAALLLNLRSLQASEMALGQEAVGPADWPRWSLIGIIAVSAMLMAMRCGRAVRVQRQGQTAAPAAPRPRVDEARLIAGAAFIVLYGFGVALIGFGFSTALFLFAWLLLSGTQRVFTALLTSVLGTLALLFLFVKIAYTPLPRGVGVFESATLALYRFLGFF